MLLYLQSVMSAVGGDVVMPEERATFNSMNQITDSFVNKTYKVYSGMLYCGNLSSKVQLYPPPTSATR